MLVQVPESFVLYLSYCPFCNLLSSLVPFFATIISRHSPLLLRFLLLFYHLLHFLVPTPYLLVFSFLPSRHGTQQLLCSASDLVGNCLLTSFTLHDPAPQYYLSELVCISSLSSAIFSFSLVSLSFSTLSR